MEITHCEPRYHGRYDNYATGWKIWGSNPTEGKRFFLLQNVQTDAGGHSAAYSVGNKVYIVGQKRLGREVNHSPVSSVEDKYRSYTSAPSICLPSIDKGNFTFVL